MIEQVLTRDEITANHDRFVALVRGINRPGFDPEVAIEKLEKSDFFTAPASTQYHQCYEGGLCKHSLEVYDNIVLLTQNFSSKNYTDDTLRVVALFHDLAKINQYCVDYRNVKVDGQWTKEAIYKTSPDHFVLGSHESNSLFLLERIAPLSIEEAAAILHHHGGMGWDSAKDNISEVYSKYPLGMYLYMADMISAYEV